MAIDETGQTSEAPSFDVDGTLGRLAKWLRILGFDAEYPCSIPSQGRYFVTTREIEGGTLAVKITAEGPLEQLKQVIEQTGVSVDSDRFFSRCLICNLPVKEVPKEFVAGRVPEEVFADKSEFHECPGCKRVYWEGSHLGRTKKRLEDVGIV